MYIYIYVYIHLIPVSYPFQTVNHPGIRHRLHTCAETWGKIWVKAVDCGWRVHVTQDFEKQLVECG